MNSFFLQECLLRIIFSQSASRDPLPLGSTVVLCAVYHNNTWELKILAHSIIQIQAPVLLFDTSIRT